MTKNRALFIGLILVLAAVALSVWAYPSLPDRVPTHWDLAGHVNGYSSRSVAVGLTPVIAAFVWLLMLVLPAISPRGFRLDASATPFYAGLLALIAILVAIHAVLLRAAQTGTAPSFILIFALIGALLIIIGSLIGKLKKNFFIGVRTPWTLASDEVWTRTNKFAGQLLVAGGIVIVLASFFGSAVIPTLIVVVALVALISVAYSYLLYRRIEGFGPDPSS
jgi:uncharacterized membrane protein